MPCGASRLHITRLNFHRLFSGFTIDGIIFEVWVFQNQEGRVIFIIKTLIVFKAYLTYLHEGSLMQANFHLSGVIQCIRIKFIVDDYYVCG